LDFHINWNVWSGPCYGQRSGWSVMGSPWGIHGGMQDLDQGFIGAAMPGGGGGGLLLDAYPSAAFAYSFRKLRAAYAGAAVRIRRNNDDAEADIGFSGNDFDAAAAAAHIGANEGYIVTWYDQSGNGLDVTQATGVLQWDYTAASSIGGLPGALAQAGRGMARASVADTAFGSGTQFTILAAMEQTGAGSAENMFLSWNEASTPTFLIWATHQDSLYMDFGTGGGSGRVNVSQPGGWDDTPHILECYRDSSDNQAIVVDGSSLVSASRTDDLSTASATLRVGKHSAGTADFVGFISEVVFWGTDLGSTDRAGARDNMNSYYSVF
jgi:hypothetical protein